LPYATRILSCFGTETARLLMLSGARELARDARAHQFSDWRDCKWRSCWETWRLQLPHHWNSLFSTL